MLESPPMRTKPDPEKELRRLEEELLEKFSKMVHRLADLEVVRFAKLVRSMRQRRSRTAKP